VNKQILANDKIEKLEQEKLLIAAKSLLDGENQERSRIARELHDGLGSTLTMAKLKLSQIEEKDPVIFKNQHEAILLLDKSIEEMRRLAHNLMPDALLRFGLKSFLEDFCKGSDIIHFYFYGTEKRLNETIEINIYRIVTELVNNALKHANASAINIQMLQTEDKLSITVQDNGKGFRVEENKQAGIGLTNIRSRVEFLGATLNFFSEIDKGSEFTTELKLQEYD
jgi:signal transduction histidine kinase